MYKLILVDDEEEVRKGVLKKIEWNKYGFEIVGEAENGREALDIAEKVIPDVVVTDIKMPFMDGIRLAEELKERFPTTKTIILTGFDEFEYAHKAIKLNVVEYVLKPISSKELIEVLVKTKEKLDNDIEQKKNIEILREHYTKSLPILKEKFLSSLVGDRLRKEEIEEKSKNYNIDLQGYNFVVSIVNINYSSQSMDYEEKDLAAFSVLNIVNEVVDNYNLGIVFIDNGRIVVITVCKKIERNDAISVTIRALEEIDYSIKKYLKLSITIGVGTFFSHITDIGSSYQNALAALDYRMVMGENKIIWIEDVEPQGKNRVVFDETKERDLTSSLKLGNEDNLCVTIDNLFKEIIEARASLKDYQIYLMEIVTTILKVAQNFRINTEGILGHNYNIFTELYKFNNLKEVRGWIKNIALKIMKSIAQGRKDSCKLIVEGAKEYIAEHFSDSDVSINKLCAHLHISPAYFSSIFKKETKMTFVNYLTQVRMDAAKVILKTTNLKSFEVAEKVGYSEPNYFSYCFKKYFGISPSEFRNSN